MVSFWQRITRIHFCASDTDAAFDGEMIRPRRTTLSA
jgi:hypothetical protein